MPILFLSPTDLLFYRHLHGNAVWNCAVFSINYFHSLITNFRRQTSHCWPPQEWIVLQWGCIREMSPQWKQKGMKTLCLIYFNPDTSFPVSSLLNLYLLVKGKIIDPRTVIPLESYKTGAIKVSWKKSLLLDNKALCLSLYQGCKTTNHHSIHSRYTEYMPVLKI